MTAHVHNGGPTEEALFAWRAGRLHPEAAEWLREHVHSCGRCRSVVSRIDAVHTALEPPPEPPFMRHADITAVRRRLSRRRPSWRPLGVAALAGGLVGFALMVFLH